MSWKQRIADSSGWLPIKVWTSKSWRMWSQKSGKVSSKRTMCLIHLSYLQGGIMRTGVLKVKAISQEWLEDLNSVRPRQALKNQTLYLELVEKSSHVQLFKRLMISCLNYLFSHFKHKKINKDLYMDTSGPLVLCIGFLLMFHLKILRSPHSCNKRK